MGFFIFMFICNLLIPLLMIICGYFMRRKPPKEINGLIGYRTAMSRKNKDTWDFDLLRKVMAQNRRGFNNTVRCCANSFYQCG